MAVPQLWNILPLGTLGNLTISFSVEYYKIFFYLDLLNSALFYISLAKLML